MLAHGCQVTQTPPSTTSLNQIPQRNKATVCYMCTPSPFHCCLSSSTKRSAGCLSPLNEMISPRGGRSCSLLVPCHAHLHGSGDSNQKLQPLPRGYRQGDLAAARPSGSAKRHIFLCSGRHCNVLDSGEMQTPPSPIQIEPLCS